MPQDLHSAEQVADLLGLHVRTVRHYVREGRLKAVRIGKQYRIARADLEAFTGQPLPEPVRRTRYVEVSSIVEIDAVDSETAGRIATGLNAAAKGRDRGQPLRIDTIYDAARARLKVIVTGGLATTAELLKFANLYLESAS
jgi:excisionase family DNA binding protein